MDIFEAAEKGNIERVSEIIAGVNSSNENGETALMLAARKGRVRLVRLLVAHGADVRAVNKTSDTALSIACQECHVEVVKELLKAPGEAVNISNEREESPLLVAVKLGRVDIVTALLDAGAEIHKCDANEKSVVRWAAERDNLPMVRLLLARGADIDGFVDTNPLIAVASLANVPMAEELVARGADVNVTNEFGDTALVWACDKDVPEMVMTLVQAGANPHHITKKGATCACLARSEHTKLLIQKYQSGTGLSWVEQELLSRGLKWEAICPVVDILLKEGFVDKPSFVKAPLLSFTDAYLREIGIAGLSVHHKLIETRLQATWLGHTLAELGFESVAMAEAERAVIQGLMCSTEELFARLPGSNLDQVLFRAGLTAGLLRETLVDLHTTLQSASMKKRKHDEEGEKDDAAREGKGGVNN